MLPQMLQMTSLMNALSWLTQDRSPCCWSLVLCTFVRGLTLCYCFQDAYSLLIHLMKGLLEPF